MNRPMLNILYSHSYLEEGAVEPGHSRAKDGIRDEAVLCHRGLGMSWVSRVS